MNTDKNDGIVGLLMKITVVLAVLKVLGILSIHWIEVFAPAGMAAGDSYSWINCNMDLRTLERR